MANSPQEPMSIMNLETIRQELYDLDNGKLYAATPRETTKCRYQGWLRRVTGCCGTTLETDYVKHEWTDYWAENDNQIVAYSVTDGFYEYGRFHWLGTSNPYYLKHCKETTGFISICNGQVEEVLKEYVLQVFAHYG